MYRGQFFNIPPLFDGINGLGDTVFQGRVVHIPIDTPVVDEQIPQNPPATMVQWRSMALERWFSVAQPVGGQAIPPPPH